MIAAFPKGTPRVHGGRRGLRHAQHLETAHASDENPSPILDHCDAIRLRRRSDRSNERETLARRDARGHPPNLQVAAAVDGYHVAAVRMDSDVTHATVVVTAIRRQQRAVLNAPHQNSAVLTPGHHSPAIAR